MKFGPRLVRPSPDQGAGSTLNRVADTLGVPLEQLYEPVGPLILHASSDGTRWLLVCDALGNPVIRRMGGGITDPDGQDVSVSSFLTRDTGSPQHKALVALTERLLTAHLAGWPAPLSSLAASASSTSQQVD